jgi:hypothetical protein
LRTHSPMVCHWDYKRLQFQEAGQPIHLQGIQQEQLSLAAISPEQFVKWHTGNDIWALAAVQQSCEQVPVTHPPTIATVLEEFTDVLAETRPCLHTRNMITPFLCCLTHLLLIPDPTGIPHSIKMK